MRASILSLFACILLMTSCQNQKPELVWVENFDGNVLNENNWNLELGDGCPNLCGWGNDEAQHYTKSNHSVKNGLLTITAKKDNSGYTSTRITTKEKFEYMVL